MKFKDHETQITTVYTWTCIYARMLELDGKRLNYGRTDGKILTPLTLEETNELGELGKMWDELGSENRDYVRRLAAKISGGARVADKSIKLNGIGS